MKKILVLLAISALIFSCSNDKKESKIEKKSELSELKIPAGYALISKAEGDLDADGKDEKVFVYDTDSIGAYGNVREIYICKKENNKWMLWKTVIGPALSSQAGMMGDLIIDKGKLYITHYVNALERIYYNHCYEYIDKDFRLVEVVVDCGRPCAKWETYRYDLKTGKITYDLAPDECDDAVIEEYVIAAHEEYNIKTSELPLMNGFAPGNQSIKLPDGSDSFYY